MILDEQCFKNRKGKQSERIKCCNECLHYKYCKNGESKYFESEEGMYRVGCAVILDVCGDYESAYKSGARRNLQALEKWLRSELPNVLSGEKVDGNALADAIKVKCKKMYGDFEKIYEEVQATNKEKLKCLLLEQKNAKTQEERAELRRKIHKVKGVLNS